MSKTKNLIPLKEEDKRLPPIAKILGTTFGDGGIFSNMNAIFLSSAEMSSIEEFQKDLEFIFGDEIKKNSRIIKGGKYGSSYCSQNTNRKVVRFFQALGAPIGRKSNIKLKIPTWALNQDSFFSALFGNEIGIPRIHSDQRGTNSLDLGLVCKKGLYQNRIGFLKQIQSYLNYKTIKADKIYTSQHKKDKSSYILKLAINLNFDNLMNFNKNIKIYYSKNKQEKLINTLNSLKELKLKRFKKLSNTINPLTKVNYSKDWIKHNLRLTDKSLNFILNQEPIEKWN